MVRPAPAGGQAPAAPDSARRRSRTPQVFHEASRSRSGGWPHIAGHMSGNGRLVPLSALPDVFAQLHAAIKGANKVAPPPGRA